MTLRLLFWALAGYYWVLIVLSDPSVSIERGDWRYLAFVVPSFLFTSLAGAALFQSERRVSLASASIGCLLLLVIGWSLYRQDLWTLASVSFLLLLILAFSHHSPDLDPGLLNRIFLGSILLSIPVYHLGISQFGYLPGQSIASAQQALQWRISLFPSLPESAMFSGMILVLNLIFQRLPHRRLVMWLAGYFLLFSGLRSAVIATAAAIFYLWVIRRWVRRMPRFSIAALIVIIILIAVALHLVGPLEALRGLGGDFLQVYLFRSPAGQAPLDVSATIARTWVWKQHMSALFASNLLGIGTFTFQDIVHSPWIAIPPNITGSEAFLTGFLVRVGIWGLLLPFAVLRVSYVALRAGREASPTFTLMFLCLSLLYGSFVTPYNFVMLLFLFLIFGQMRPAGASRKLRTTDGRTRRAPAPGREHDRREAVQTAALQAQPTRGDSVPAGRSVLGYRLDRARWKQKRHPSGRAPSGRLLTSLSRPQPVEENMDEGSVNQVSFLDIVVRVWSRRGLIISLAVLGLLGASGLTFLQAGFGSVDIAHWITLKGIDRGEYPGGAAFSPRDLQTPEVISAAAAAVGLDPRDLPEISEWLRVEYSSPVAAGIIRKYRERLAASQLSAAEIDTLNQEFKEELEVATYSTLRLEISPGAAGLGAARATKLLSEIPAHWTRIYSERYRIFEPPGLEAVPLEIVPLSDPTAIIVAMQAIESVSEGLAAIAADNRVSHLVNPSGKSASELRRDLQVLDTVQFRPLSQTVLSTPDPIAESYRQNLRLRINYLKAQVASYTVMVEEIRRGREGAAAEWARTADPTRINQLQLAGDSLQTIIELAERASSANFLRQVMLDRHELATQLASVELALARSELLGTLKPTEAAVEETQQRLLSLLSEYEALRSIVVDRLRSELGSLYTVSTPPTRVKATGLADLGMRVLGAVLAALFLGLLIAVVLPSPQANKVQAA